MRNNELIVTAISVSKKVIINCLLPDAKLPIARCEVAYPHQNTFSANPN
jgi:hypothetical protein